MGWLQTSANGFFIQGFYADLATRPAYFQMVFHPDPFNYFAIHFKGHENLYDNMLLKKRIIKMNVNPKIVLKSKANIKT
jgi:hypothetical protein